MSQQQPNQNQPNQNQPNQNQPNQNQPNQNQPNQNQNSATSQRSSTTPIPQTAAAGGLTITQPPQTSVSFFKIAPGELVTFGWNMTSVIATPTHLTVSAVCDNGNTYPVGPTDGIIPGTASSVVWDVYSYQTNNPGLPLAQASYVLHIWDDRGPDSVRSPGRLVPNSALRFALYTPQPYTDISAGWTCAACNGAFSIAAQPAFVGVMAAFIVMFLSGFTLIWNAPNRR